MTDETVKEKQQQQGKSWWSGMKNSIVNYASAKIMGIDTSDGGGEAAPSKTPVPDKVRLMCEGLLRMGVVNIIFTLTVVVCGKDLS